ncbi:hypothetical protein CAL7716_081060 [Calothrix sp. PCC 7716]|nr:hypothetical protein CAL7716_081060 [Calothrix sp. PCC 7716]
MANFKFSLRQLHRILAPLMALPLLLSLTTGTAYAVSEIVFKDERFRWLIKIHEGNFGWINLEDIYPFINAAGLLTLIITGAWMWFQTQKKSKVRHYKN